MIIKLRHEDDESLLDRLSSVTNENEILSSRNQVLEEKVEKQRKEINKLKQELDELKFEIQESENVVFDSSEIDDIDTLGKSQGEIANIIIQYFDNAVAVLRHKPFNINNINYGQLIKLMTLALGVDDLRIIPIKVETRPMKWLGLDEKATYIQYICAVYNKVYEAVQEAFYSVPPRIEFEVDQDFINADHMLGDLNDD